MDIKLIAIDMDGTLLRGDSSISPRTREVIQSVIDAGYYVAPATGRSYRNAAHVLREFEGIAYYVNANGAIAVQAQGEKVIHTQVIPYQTVREICDLAGQYELFVELYEGLDAYVDKYGVKYLYQAGLMKSYCDQLLSTDIELDSLDSFVEDPARQIGKIHIVCMNVDQKFQLKRQIDALEGVNPVSVIPINLEIVQGAWSKADGLNKLTEYLHLKPENVLAIGDSDNDLDMLKWAGASVAMGNGNQHVKEVADYVTSSNEEDGVAKALLRYL
ncbi:MAG: HAD family phosphatase [Lachnospiraceae bacterium]|nr:HAD family phosphatase [Lachnospiraceae bacterium]